VSRLDRAVAVAGLVGLGCGAPDPPPETGGASLPVGPCGRGVIVVSSDYQSTNVGLFDWDGVERSGSVVSSGSSSPGLSTALSGDVTAPTSLQPGRRFALIDRFPASVLTWVDVETGEVTGQLSVQTGFAANPQDYALVASDKAYVSRYEPNPSPGAEPFDGGSDVLIVDPSAPSIVGRIDLGFAVEDQSPALFARPSRIVTDLERAYVLLSPYSIDFTESGEATLAEIRVATDEVIGALRLPGLHGCKGLALSPLGDAVAVSCSGSFEGSNSPTLDTAGVVVIDLGAESGGMVERVRISGAKLGAPPAFSIGFASDERVIVPTFGALGNDGTTVLEDQVLELALDTGVITRLAARPPFSLGEVRCGAACGRCFVADADQGALIQLDIESGVAAVGSSDPVFPELALPPRYLGAL
jgi:hypothetical protein